MADLGLQGFPIRLTGPDWLETARSILDPLPPAFRHGSRYRITCSSTTQPWPEGWTRLTYLAATFPRYRVGHLVLGQSYRNPGLLGAMAATLQSLSGGRFILGLGAGWLEDEYRAFGYDYPSGGTRVAQLAEAIELIRTLWTESPATYHGEWYHLEAARCERPDPIIPILVGTNGPKALKVVARLADQWNWDGPWEMTYRASYERLRAECEAIGRPFEEILLTASLQVSLPDDPSTFEPSYSHDFYPGQVFGIVGPTPADVIREIELLVDVGVSHFPLAFDDLAGLQQFVAEVVPHVRLERRS